MEPFKADVMEHGVFSEQVGQVIIIYCPACLVELKRATLGCAACFQQTPLIFASHLAREHAAEFMRAGNASRN